MSVDLRNCVITHLTAPPAPTGLSYSIFNATPLDVNLANPGFVQVPACGYTLTETRDWNFVSPGPITQTNDYAIRVVSSDPAHRNTYSVSLTTSSRYDALGVSFSASVSFSILVTDPC